MHGNQGYSGYYDSSAEAGGRAMSGFEGLGAIHEGDFPLLYVPDLAPVGSGSSYYPRSVDDDAVALNTLGFQAGFPGGGNGLARDHANAEGAFDSTFRGAVTAFQLRHPASGKADGWIGPNTRRALAAAIAVFNATPRSPNALPLPRIPPANPAPGGGSSPAPGKVVPVAPGAVAAAPDHTVRNVAIAGGALAVLGGLYYAFR